VDNRLHAQFLENHCPKYVWSAIVCSDRDDQTLLDRELKPFYGTVIRRDLHAPSYTASRFPVTEQVRFRVRSWCDIAEVCMLLLSLSILELVISQ
jgi:hypothetical protein